MTVHARWWPVLVVAIAYASIAVVLRFVFMPLVTVSRWHGASPEARHFYELNDRVRAVARSLHAVAIRDSIVPLLPREPRVVVETPTHLNEASLRLLHERVQQDIGDHPKAVVGVYVIPYYTGIHQAMTQSTQLTSVMLTGTRERPYCIVATETQPPPRSGLMIGPDKLAPDGSLLTACGFWARYGAPGSNIKAWLDRGGYDFANRKINPSYIDEYYVRETLFGASVRYYFGSKDGEECFSGQTEACARGVLDTVPRSLRSGVANVYPTSNHWTHLMSGEAVLMHELEAEFGSERFARFWTSDADVTNAFKDAFGIELGVWVRDWFARKYGTRRAGPSVPADSLLLSLLTIGLVVGIAVMVGQRRHIG